MDKIILDKVTKIYRRDVGKITAVKNVSIRFGEGIYIITGGNASGKSTMLRIIAGITKPDSGSVYVLGKKLYSDCDEKCSSKMRRDEVGFMPQTLLIPNNFSAIKAAGFPLIIKNVKDWEKVTYSYLSDIGLSDVANIKCKYLSVGQRQRLAFIRSIISDPKIILLDEPFSHQDLDGVKMMSKIIINLSRGKTILLATPDIDIVKRFFPVKVKILKMRKGEILEEQSL